MKLNRYGFTLIEILAVVVLLAISVLALSRLQVLSMRSGVLSKEAMVATAAAQRQMEVLKNTAFASIADGGPENVPNQPGMVISWNQVLSVSPLSGANYKTVTVTVQWPTNQRIVLTTIISEI